MRLGLRLIDLRSGPICFLVFCFIFKCPWITRQGRPGGGIRWPEISASEPGAIGVGVLMIACAGKGDVSDHQNAHKIYPGEPEAVGSDDHDPQAEQDSQGPVVC